jgi:SPP1 family predicted phage head-tail adaptor
MKAGEMRDRIELYRLTTTTDGEGGTTGTYALLSTRYADVEMLSQSEVVRSGMVVGESVYRIKFRKGQSETLSRQDQIRYDGKRLNITSIVSDDYQFTVVAQAKQ